MTIPMMTPGQSLQRKSRVYRTYTDQHGRKFGAVADAMNNQPIGEFTPLGCNPPWLPPMRFAIFTDDGSLDFRWAYEIMAAELAAGTAEYYQDAVKFAIENNKPEPDVGGPVDRSIRYVLGPPPLSPAIALSCEQGDPWMLGIPNAPVNIGMRDILSQGMSANSKEALDIIRASVRKNVDASAVPMVETRAVAEPVAEHIKTIHTPAPLREALGEVNYKEFLIECRSRGMTLGDIGAAWQEHKRNMAEV